MSPPYNNNSQHYRNHPPYRHTYHHRHYNLGRFGYRRSNPIYTYCFCFIFVGVFLIIGETSFLPQTNSNYILLAPQETFLLNTNNAILIEITAENEIESSFFNEEPPLTEEIYYQENTSFLLNSDYYEYRVLYMKTESQFMLDFESSAKKPLNFYIIKGDSEFSDFENPNYDFSSEEDEYIASLSNFTFTSEESDYYYIVWNNRGFPTTINYTIDVTLTEYNVSNPLAWKNGRFAQENSIYPYMVIKNNDNSSIKAVSYRVELHPFIQNPIPRLAGVTGLLVLIGIVVFESYKSPQNTGYGQKEIAADIDTSRYGASTTSSSDNLSMGSYPCDDISNSRNSMRSIPISCNFCGATLDEEPLKFLIIKGFMFCSTCGTKITK